MASTITVPSADIVTEAKVATAFTQAKADVEALQLGTNVVNSTVAAGAAIVVTNAAHNRKTILLDTAAGTTVALPVASGSGARFRFLVTVVTTASGTVVVTATGSTFQGVIFGERADSGNAVLGFAAAAGNNTLTMDHAAKGGVSKGEWFEVEDIAATIYSIRGMFTATGAAFGTPFSTA